MLRALRHRDFRLLWIGQAVSLLGDGIYLVAIAWLVYDISNEPGALALVGLAWTLPQVAGLLVGGVLSDRFERRRLLVIADLLRFAAIAVIAALALADEAELWHLVVLVVIYGLGEALWSARRSSCSSHSARSRCCCRTSSGTSWAATPTPSAWSWRPAGSARSWPPSR